MEHLAGVGVVVTDVYPCVCHFYGIFREVHHGFLQNIFLPVTFPQQPRICYVTV